jgi:hypothetical protein
MWLLSRKPSKAGLPQDFLLFFFETLPKQLRKLRKLSNRVGKLKLWEREREREREKKESGRGVFAKTRCTEPECSATSPVSKISPAANFPLKLVRTVGPIELDVKLL